MSSVKLLRRPEVCAMVGLKRTAIDDMERAGKFPKRVRISDHAVAWVEREVREWVEQRMQDRGPRPARSSHVAGISRPRSSSARSSQSKSARSQRAALATNSKR